MNHLFPETPAVGHHWLSIAFVATVGAAAHFHRRILAIDRRTPVFNAYFLGMIGLSAASLLAHLAGYFTEAARVLTLAALLFPVLGLVRTAMLWRQGRAESLFIAVGYAIGLVSYLVAVLSVQGVLQGQFWHLYSFQGGTLFALLAFNFGLFERLRHVQRQRDEAVIAAQQARIERDAETLARGRQGALLAMLTHELKTPLAVIRLALDRLSGEAGVRRHAATAITDIAGVIDRCRYADRIDHEQIHVQRSSCRVDEMLADCLAATSATRLRLTLPEALPVIDSDPALVRTICTNLLDNALKYSPPESVVDCAVTVLADGIEIDVANRPGAAGLPDPQRLFRRYHRGPGAHAQTGSGLGLYLAGHLADLLGGEIRYHPPDASARLHFVFRLPCVSPRVTP